MFMIGPLGFTAPLILLGLVLLPVLWLLLRAVPPAPVRRRFPGVALLLGLDDDENEADKTPWWLLLLRMAAVAAAIIGFAGPVLNPRAEQPGTGPLLILADASWADAAGWGRRIERMDALLEEAGAGARPVAVVLLADPPEGPLPFQGAEVWRSRLAGLRPAPWAPEPSPGWIAALAREGAFDTVWLSDGLARESRAPLLAALEAHGGVRVIESPRPVLGLGPVRFEAGEIAMDVLRSRTEGPLDVAVAAIGPDPGGVIRELARVEIGLEPGAGRAEARFSLPAELRNRITRFAISGLRSAGAVQLADDGLRRREVALIAGRADREGLDLLDPLHYLRKALEPSADLLEGGLDAILPANPDVIVLADVARLSPAEAEALGAWVDEGGLLVRFAGPQLAASDVSRGAEDPLMPVRLRAGGRVVGGAMSWGTPKKLRPFAPESPFFGLEIPQDVEVSAQVLAEPDPTLSSRVIAALADGTPLVTRKRIGQGQVVLFHVTANAEWSSLPLSGLFVEMLERLAVSARKGAPGADSLAGTEWRLERRLDGFGELADAPEPIVVKGEALAMARPGPALPPGLYAGEERSLAVNVLGDEAVLAPAAWPARIAVEGIAALRETGLKGIFLAAALVLLLLDLLASLWLSGRLRAPRRGLAAGALLLGLCLGALAPAPGVRAQEGTSSPSDEAPPSDEAEARAIAAASKVTLAYVITGDRELDRISEAGLLGLSDILFRRTSVEPGLPMGVDLERDDLSLFPLLYWPISTSQPRPSKAAYAKLNEFLRRGGMILFDTRDGDLSGLGQSTPEGRKLQALALPLDIPPLEPVPEDHVLTRTFYLLQTFPGRYDRPVWAEAAPPDAEKVEGMPFRNLNDGVSPVIIGGNDWAAAWAVDRSGAPLLPVGRGYTGERQREMAYRFGVNLVMYVLTGNYKSDQVHVPALLERLGQ